MGRQQKQHKKGQTDEQKTRRYCKKMELIKRVDNLHDSQPAADRQADIVCKGTEAREKQSEEEQKTFELYSHANTLMKAKN